MGIKCPVKSGVMLSSGRLKLKIYLGSGLCALGIEVELSQIPGIFFTVLSTRKEFKRNHLTQKGTSKI
jgi:hypothetical protein